MSEHEPDPGQPYEDWLAEGYGPSIADIRAALKAENARLTAERDELRAALVEARVIVSTLADPPPDAVVIRICPDAARQMTACIDRALGGGK